MTAAEYLALACPHFLKHPPARSECRLCHFEAVREMLDLRARHYSLRDKLAVVGGERDSLQLRVQQLDADEDRLDFLDENASHDMFDDLRTKWWVRKDIREAIDWLRGAQP